MTLCHCGRPLHYTDLRLEEQICELVRRHGEHVLISVNGRRFKVQRHYVALHGIKPGELPNLGFEEVTSPAPSTASVPSLVLVQLTMPIGAPMPQETQFGPCCICDGSANVRTIVMLDKEAPIPGHGWGCLTCGKPSNGAVAVICDACAEAPDVGKRLRFACRGYPASEGRIPIAELTKPFHHDLTKHPELGVRQP
jgi:hypothetical protein